MSTLERLKAGLINHPGIDTDVDRSKITPSASLREDLGFDSLDEVAIELMIEEEFRIHVEVGASDNWRTIADVIAFVERTAGAGNIQYD